MNRLVCQATLMLLTACIATAEIANAASRGHLVSDDFRSLEIDVRTFRRTRVHTDR